MALHPQVKNTTMKLTLENGNSWCFEINKNITGAMSRFISLFNIKDFSNNKFDTIFPYYPPAIKNNYTFFDLTRDILSFFNWLKFQGPGKTILIRENSAEILNEYFTYVEIGTISRVIALQNEIFGGLLVHGIMLEYQERAIILAGSSGVGKTTAASRMPDIWQKCSDDLTLIVKDLKGNYYAHPWPGPKAYKYNDIRYNVPNGVSLKALFFLAQAPQVNITPTKPIKAIAMLQRVTNDAMELPDPSINSKGVGEIIKNRFNNITEFVKKVPIYDLYLNKTDPFWEEIGTIIF